MKIDIQRGKWQQYHNNGEFECFLILTGYILAAIVSTIRVWWWVWGFSDTYWVYTGGHSQYQQSMMVSLRVFRCSDAVYNQLHVKTLFWYYIYKEVKNTNWDWNSQTTSILLVLLKQNMSPTGPNKFHRGITPKGSYKLHLFCITSIQIHTPNLMSISGKTTEKTNFNKFKQKKISGMQSIEVTLDLYYV